ncbi:MAG TPA: GDP-L-fucose synthase [Candidatus Omnitrophota bacterium]|nr:GDP-L-fucose synthase [Candidatus Omnitrophota bacterium]
MKNDSKILIVGHDDVIERSLVQGFRARGFSKVFSSSMIALDTTIQSSTYQFFAQERPEYVFLASVRSGGIEANQKSPADFFYANSESQNNVVYAARKFGVKKLLYFASSCVYPKEAEQPLEPESLMTGEMEPTSKAYSTAKLAGIVLCQSYRKQYGLDATVVIPATIYGPDSDTDLATAHVLGALVQKFHMAKINHDKDVIAWGTGHARREFLFSEDFVEGCLFVADQYQELDIVNLGCGEDVSIKDLAFTIKGIVGFSGEIVFDPMKPEGAKRKLLNSSTILQMGWKPKISLRTGIQKTYQAYLQKIEKRKE